ncbi:unnamed protein product, partial [Thlaspi arvense]
LCPYLDFDGKDSSFRCRFEEVSFILALFVSHRCRRPSSTSPVSSPATFFQDNLENLHLQEHEKPLPAEKVKAFPFDFQSSNSPEFPPTPKLGMTGALLCDRRGFLLLDLVSYGNVDRDIEQAVFQRYLRPEKDYLSFSLVYSNRKRTLDVICKDKVEAEVWIAGLKALISGQGGRSKIDGWSDGGLSIADSRDLTLGSPTNSSVCASRDFNTVENPYSSRTSRTENSVSSERSHVASGSPNMLVRGSGSDVFRVSVSSAQSNSSHGSAPGDCDALGDVYIWGEVLCDNVVKLGPDKNASCLASKSDVLVPKPLESNVVLDVHQIACGVKHAALVSRQGEVFTWGEESGGRLGHGMGKDVTEPQLVESLAVSSVDFVACGEFHTCAVTMTGEIYTWGDGKHNAGLLGHGTDVSHWIPKRISGPLEGLRVASVSCGPWHTALITSTGQLFTFGDGTFGVLGHGDKETVFYPREVESLSGLKTIAVACGVWHAAAVVEVIVTHSSSSVPSGKLFTWGDGDKNRLGHGDKEPRLKPTCVSALIDHTFHRVACGHSLTVGLTTSGKVFTMGSTVYGQLGNPIADGKLPCLVEHKLTNDCVEEVACGAYHVAALTSRNEVFTWGKGANGRLGHGDVEDRNAPTLVVALKERHVKYVACGSNFTAAICLHKWVSNTEQSQCSACRQAFGFTRKSHNCYNCGLVHCHSCSSKKSLKAALAPNPGKPYRVCDSCYSKLSKVSEAGIDSRKNAMPRLSGENKDRLDKAELRLAKSGIPSKIDLIKQLDNRAARQGKKGDTFSLKDALSNVAELRRGPPKPAVTPSGANSRSVSPFSRRSSPPRSVTPIPSTTGLGVGLGFSTSITESLKKTNELLNQEVVRLRAQAESMRQRCEVQEFEVQRSVKKVQEAMKLATEESTKSEVAKEVIKSLTSQLKDVVKLLPPGAYEAETTRTANLLNGFEQNGFHFGQRQSRSDSIMSETSLASPLALPSRLWRNSQSPRNTDASMGRDELRSDGVRISNGYSEDGDSRRNSRSSAATSNASQVEAEWIEQYEPGVYITLLALGDGTRDLKRVRFSRRRFREQQAEAWWSENRERVYEKYNIRGTDRSSLSVYHYTLLHFIFSSIIIVVSFFASFSFPKSAMEARISETLGLPSPNLNQCLLPNDFNSLLTHFSNLTSSVQIPTVRNPEAKTKLSRKSPKFSESSTGRSVLLNAPFASASVSDSRPEFLKWIKPASRSSPKIQTLTKHLSVFERALIGAGAGGIAGAFTYVCLLPLDTIKTKLQTKGASQLYSSSFDAIVKTFQSKGILGFYSGVSAVIVGSTFSSAVYFGTCEFGKSLLSKSMGFPPVLIPPTAGAMGNIISSAIMVPKELITQRMQAGASGRSYQVDAVNKLGAAVYTGVTGTVRQILKEEGWVGFTRGMGPRVVHSACFSAIGYFAFETARLTILNEYLKRKEDSEATVDSAS